MEIAHVSPGRDCESALSQTVKQPLPMRSAKKKCMYRIQRIWIGSAEKKNLFFTCMLRKIFSFCFRLLEWQERLFILFSKFTNRNRAEKRNRVCSWRFSQSPLWLRFLEQTFSHCFVLLYFTNVNILFALDFAVPPSQNSHSKTTGLTINRLFSWVFFAYVTFS